jgi:hypothetical protein
MDNKDKKKIINYVWIVTDLIILICSVLLLIDGGTTNIILAVIGILLVIFEIFLYKKGFFKNL